MLYSSLKVKGIQRHSKTYLFPCQASTHIGSAGGLAWAGVVDVPFHTRQEVSDHLHKFLLFFDMW